jgi:phage tail-like protein
MRQIAASTVTTVRLEVRDRLVGFFTGMTGLGSEMDLAERREEAAAWSNVVLSRPLTKDSDLWDWHSQVLDGNPKRAWDDATIELLDFAGNAVAGYGLRRAWPAGYWISLHDGEPPVESITLCHEGFEIQ